MISSKICGIDCINDSEVLLSDLEILCSELGNIYKQQSKGFSGRGEIYSVTISNNRKVILKSYLHGGFFRKLFGDKYFSATLIFGKKFSATRSYREFEVLNFLRNAGLRVPKPAVCFINRSVIPGFYRAFLGTFEISNAKTLIDLATTRDFSKELAVKIGYAAGNLAKEVLRQGVLHQDLHLGNVLVASDLVYLIDFDKCKIVSPDKTFITKGLESLEERWIRSVEKRVQNKKISDVLCSSFISGLRYAS